MGKRNISLLILTVVCFVVVLLGSVFSGNRRPLLSGVLGLTILICIIVQVITILKTARKNRRGDEADAHSEHPLSARPT